MRIPVSGTILNVETRSGGDPAFLFLHDAGAAASAWDDIAAKLAPQHLCVAVDLPGCGESERYGIALSVSSVADDLAALISRLPLKEYIVVGHSMGALIAAALSARKPDGLKGVIFVAPPSAGDSNLHRHGGSLWGPARNRDDVMALAKKLAARRISQERLEVFARDHLRCASASWEWWREHGSREDISHYLENIHVPTLLVYGSHDPMLSEESAKQFAQTLANARVLRIERAGHLLPFEAPDEVAEAITAFAWRRGDVPKPSYHY